MNILLIILKIEYYIRTIYWWLFGYIICYSPHSSGTAFCKRSIYHLGKHKSDSGKLWK